MDGGRRLRRVCQAANAMALRAASDVSSCGKVGNISKCSEAKRVKALMVRSCDVEEFTFTFCEQCEGRRENTYGPRPMMAVSQNQAGVVCDI